MLPSFYKTAELEDRKGFSIRLTPYTKKGKSLWGYGAGALFIITKNRPDNITKGDYLLTITDIGRGKIVADIENKASYKEIIELPADAFDYDYIKGETDE